MIQNGMPGLNSNTFAIYEEQWTSGTDGAAAANTAYVNRTINTMISDIFSLFAIAPAGSLTCQVPGLYQVAATGIATDCFQHRIALKLNGNVVAHGLTASATINAGHPVTSSSASPMNFVLRLEVGDVLTFQQWTKTAAGTGVLGVAAGISSINESYCSVRLELISL